MVEAVEIEIERQCRKRIELFAGYVVCFVHLFKHYVAAGTCTLRMAQGVEIRRILYHADKHCGLFDVELVGSGVKIYFGGALDSYGVVKEVELVEIHLDDFLFTVETFELDGYHPFYGFLHSTAEHAGTRWGVELFGELLGDGGAAAGAFVAKQHGFEYGTAYGFGIDAGMAFETDIFGCDKGVDYVWRDFVEIGIHAVACATEVSPHLFAVGGEYDGSELVLRVFKFFDRRHVSYDSIIDKNEENC